MDREGGGFISKSVICIVVLGILAYSAINLGMPWFNYYSFKDRLKEVALYEARGPREKVMKIIMETAEDKDVPLDEKDVEIVQTGKKAIIRVEWNDEVQLFGGWITKVWHFSVDTGME